MRELYRHARPSAKALAEEQDEVLEEGLWAAFRALEENASLARQLASRARQHGRQLLAKRFTDRADDLQANADAIQRMLLGFGSPAHARVAQAEQD